MHDSDQPELGEGKTHAGAVEAIAHRGHHHRQKQQVKELEPVPVWAPPMIQSDAATSAA